MPVFRKWLGIQVGRSGNVCFASHMAFSAFAVLIFIFIFTLPRSATAAEIRNPVAVFKGLDKITGRIVAFEVSIDETVQFGSLQLTPRVCNTRPPTETPNTTAFLEVDEIGAGNKIERLFTGWAFASSPGLHGIEHPVYDIWLTDCRGGTETVAAQMPDSTSPGDAEVGNPQGIPPLPPPRSLLGEQVDAPWDNITTPPNDFDAIGEDTLPRDPLFTPIVD